jgi:hypothetical protein
MMRLPIPAVLAALVVVAAGSILLNVYFKSDAPYVLNVTDIPYRQNKTFVLDYIPHSIRFTTNVNAYYDVIVYINGTFSMSYTYGIYEYPGVCHNICYAPASNGTVIRIEPIDIRDAKVKIVVTRVWPP